MTSINLFWNTHHNLRAQKDQGIREMRKHIVVTRDHFYVLPRRPRPCTTTTSPMVVTEIVQDKKTHILIVCLTIISQTHMTLLPEQVECPKAKSRE